MDHNLFVAVFGGGGRGGSPVVSLDIAYTATQFTFKFKLPSTKYVTLYWGDGTSEKVTGQDSTLITKTSSYSAARTYNFYLGGDVTDLTYIDISSQAFVSGDISGWSALTNLTNLRANNSGVTGDVSGWSVLTSLTYLSFKTTALSGDISGFSALTSLTTLLGNNTSVSGDVAGLSALSSVVNLQLHSTSVDFDSAPAWSNVSATAVYFHDCSMTATQVNNMIESFSTCTSCTINVAGTNAHRTAASNDDLNTLLANGNTITLNDVLGAELHTSLNAANDSATEAITAFVDYSATIDGGVQVTQGQDILNMLPLGSEEVTNGDFANWTGDDPDDWTVSGESGVDPMVTEVSGACRIYTSGANVSIEQSILTTGKYYLVSVECTADVSGSLYVYGGSTLAGVIDGVATHTFAFRSSGAIFQIKRWSGATDLTIDNVSVKEIEVLGSDLVTNGAFTANADMNVSNCLNDSYDTFANGTPTGFDAIHSTSGVQFAGTADEITIVSGQKYVVSFDMVLNSGQAPSFRFYTALPPGTSISDAATSAAGHNVFELTASASATGQLGFYNTVNADYEITNLSVSDSVTDWTNETGWIVAGGLARCDGSQSGIASVYQAETYTSGDAALYKLTLSNRTAGSIRIKYGASHWSTAITADGTYTILVPSPGYGYTNIEATSDFIGDIDNVSVFKLQTTKTIASSTNYSGEHYILPEAGSDLDSFIIPATYSAESIVAQVITGETNATTGWTAANNAVLSVEETNVDTGLFAIEIESNTTPTASAHGYIDFTIVVGDTYRVSLRWRHIGSGGIWRVYYDGTAGDVLDNSETTYQTEVFYTTSIDTLYRLSFNELNASNDGGIYIDNISIKKVTLS